MFKTLLMQKDENGKYRVFSKMEFSSLKEQIEFSSKFQKNNPDWVVLDSEKQNDEENRIDAAR